MSEQRERPILFSGPMVRKLLTCARCGTLSAAFPCYKCGSVEFVKTQTRRVIKPQPGDHPNDDGYMGTILARCPYGQPISHLCVKEALRACKDSEASLPVALYDADRAPVGGPANPAAWPWKITYLTGRYMPRWASRITLEVCSVKVERLNDISRADCIAEGVECWPGHQAHRWPEENFRALWESIHGDKHPWAANEWLWVIEFRRTS